MQTERVTRSRARTLAATGETPSLAALSEKTPATRATRRRAAAAVTAPPAAAAASSAADNVQPVVLFDVTNDQDGTMPSAPAAEAAPAAPAAEDSLELPAAELSAGDMHPASSAPQADEPPATPAGAPLSPAPPAPSATPTGLGLSTLPPLSPTMATALQAATPAATPAAGVASSAGRVCDALHAAVQALGGAPLSPAPSAPPLEGELLFHGFGSPLKQAEEADSPEGIPVSISGAICPTSAARSTPGAGAGVEEEADATSSPAAGLGFDLDEHERELTLEEMMGSPFPSEREDTPEANPTPTLFMAAAPTPAAAPSAVRAAPAAAATPAATGSTLAVVRTVTKTHPLTPSRQVVLEEEEQDYIMHVAEGEAAAEEQAQQELGAAVADEDMDAAAEEPSPAAQQPAAAKARLQSKLVVLSPGFDPRSLRQLRREVADRLASKQGCVPAGLESDAEDEEGDGEYIGAVPGGQELADALGGLSLEPGMHHGLRGLPTPAGKHIRFDDDGDEAVSPRQRVLLRGVPQPQGSHIHFDE